MLLKWLLATLQILLGDICVELQDEKQRSLEAAAIDEPQV